MFLRKVNFEGKQFYYTSRSQGSFRTILFKLTALQAIEIFV